MNLFQNNFAVFYIIWVVYTNMSQYMIQRDLFLQNCQYSITVYVSMYINVEMWNDVLYMEVNTRRTVQRILCEGT